MVADKTLFRNPVQCAMILTMPRKRRKTTKRRRQKKKSRSNRRKQPLFELAPSTKRYISAIALMCAGVLLLLALSEQAGVVGDVFRQFLQFFFGTWSVVFPVFLIVSGLLYWFSETETMETKRTVGLLLCLLSFLGIMHMRAPLEDLASKRDELAGALGFMMSFPFVVFFSRIVGYIVLGAAFIVGLFISFEPDISSLWEGALSLFSGEKPWQRVRDEEEDWEEDADAGVESVYFRGRDNSLAEISLKVAVLPG